MSSNDPQTRAEERYAAVAAHVRERISSLPEDGPALVVSEGDDALLHAQRPGAAWHFPRAEDGAFGGHPADDAEAIAHLEELRERGARWLVLPATSFWWLDHYAGLHRHLLGRYEAIAAPEHDCLLFRLGDSPNGHRAMPDAADRGIPAAGRPGLVSVVIPCYDQRDYVAEAIESVLAQSYPSLEVIVVNDGSHDRPYEVVKRYSGVRALWQQNQGLAAARNAGLEKAHGAYVVFLDADDRLLPNAISIGLQTLYRAPDAAFAAGHYRVVDAAGEFKSQWERDPLGADPYEAFLRKNCIGHHGAVIYRRGVFDVVGRFDVSLPACEDYDLYLRIARRFPVLRHEEVIADYRHHEANMSNDPERMLRTVLHVLSTQHEVVKGDPALEAAHRDGMRWYRKQYGRVIARSSGLELSEAAVDVAASLDGVNTGLKRVWSGFRDAVRAGRRELGRALAPELRAGADEVRSSVQALARDVERRGPELREAMHGLKLLARYYPAGYRDVYRRLRKRLDDRRPGAGR